MTVSGSDERLVHGVRGPIEKANAGAGQAYPIEADCRQELRPPSVSPFSLSSVTQTPSPAMRGSVTPLSLTHPDVLSPCAASSLEGRDLGLMEDDVTHCKRTASKIRMRNGHLRSLFGAQRNEAPFTEDSYRKLSTESFLTGIERQRVFIEGMVHSIINELEEEPNLSLARVKMLLKQIECLEKVICSDAKNPREKVLEELKALQLEERDALESSRSLEVLAGDVTAVDIESLRLQTDPIKAMIFDKIKKIDKILRNRGSSKSHSIKSGSIWPQRKDIGAGGCGTVELASHRKEIWVVKRSKTGEIKPVELDIAARLERDPKPNLPISRVNPDKTISMALYPKSVKPSVPLSKRIEEGKVVLAASSDPTEVDRVALAYSKEVLSSTVAGLLQLNELMREDYVHLDIKPENLVRGVDGRIRLVDFGLVTKVGEPADSSGFNPRGTPLYMAPEVAVQEGEHSQKNDVWSLGVTLYHTLTGEQHPSGQTFENDVQALFYNASLKLKKGKATEFEKQLAQKAELLKARFGEGAHALIDLMVRCLKVNPDERPTLQELAAAVV